MPSPNLGPKPNNLSPVGNSGQSSAMGSLMGEIGATAGLIGGAAAVGGVSSYSTGGGFFQGAAAGAAVGAGLGMGGAKFIGTSAGEAVESASGMLKHYEYPDAAKSAAGWSEGIRSTVSGMNSNQARKATFAAGGMLGGGVFGGDRSHKRGFNSHRGNSFGR
jgi:hypothetical protein